MTNLTPFQLDCLKWWTTTPNLDPVEALTGVRNALGLSA